MSILTAPIGMSELLTLSAFLFAIGLYGLFTRRGIIAISCASSSCSTR